MLTKVIWVSGESYDKFIVFETRARFSSTHNDAVQMMSEIGGGLKSVVRVNPVSRCDLVTPFLVVWGEK